MTKTQNRFEILKLGPRPQGGESKRSADNFGHCYLPFDLAQGGELVEPFDICDLRFGISITQATLPTLDRWRSGRDYLGGIFYAQFSPYHMPVLRGGLQPGVGT
jgi:hypothetical protein